MKLILATFLAFILSVRGGDVPKTDLVASEVRGDVAKTDLVVSNVNELRSIINSMGIQTSSLRNQKAKDEWMHLQELLKESHEISRGFEAATNFYLQIKESLNKFVQLAIGPEARPSNKEEGKGCKFSIGSLSIGNGNGNGHITFNRI